MPEPFFNLEVNTEDLLDDIEVVDEKIEETTKSLDTLEKEARKKIRGIIHNAQLGWGVIQGVIRAAGGSITMTTRLVVSAGFGAIQTMVPLLAVHGSLALLAKDPVALAQVITGLAQVGTAIAALVAFESQEKQLSLQLRGVNFMLSNVNSMLYGWS